VKKKRLVVSTSSTKERCVEVPGNNNELKSREMHRHISINNLNLKTF
jgi:hypothetical protein